MLIITGDLCLLIMCGAADDALVVGFSSLRNILHAELEMF